MNCAKPDFVKKFIALLDAGASDAAIGKALKITKGAVIGRRLRLKRAPGGGKLTLHHRVRKMKPPPPPALIEPPPKPRVNVRHRTVASLITGSIIAAPVDELLPATEKTELTWQPGDPTPLGPQGDIDGCRWFFGDTRTSTFIACGHPQAKGKPYCEFHCKRAYAPPKPQRQSNGYPKAVP